MNTIEVRVLHEIPSDAYRFDIPEDRPRLRIALSQPATEVVERIASNFDEAICPACHVPDEGVEGVVPHESIIGWVLIETDDDGVPRARAGFEPFWVVEAHGKAWPLCEDCVSPVLDPIEEPS